MGSRSSSDAERSQTEEISSDRRGPRCQSPLVRDVVVTNVTRMVKHSVKPGTRGNRKRPACDKHHIKTQAQNRANRRKGSLLTDITCILSSYFEILSQARYFHHGSRHR